MSSDPRPLVDEPLALDLVNTEWIDQNGRHDLLADQAGLTVWLDATGRNDAADAGTLRALHQARAAIRAVIEHANDPAARASLNAVLTRGEWVERLGRDGPERTPATREHWALGWQAAANLLELLRDEPERIRRCSGHGCLLAFHDTSRSGRRQWCSMAVCGNRAKARRHYARTQRDPA